MHQSGENDDWGRDPSVRRMRKVFAKLEQAHNLLLKQLQISWLDTRLADVRETALVLFERALSRMGRRDDRDMVNLYLDALVQALRRADISIPESLQTDIGKIADEVISCSD